MPSESSGEKGTKDIHQVTVSPGEYHDIVMNAPIGFFKSTPEGRFLVANQALARIYGFSDPEELISSMSDLGQQLYIQPEDRIAFQSLLERYGEIQNYEYRLRRRDGTTLWVSTNAQVVQDSEGNIVYQGYTTDITERKWFEQEQRSLQEEYEKVFHSTQDAMFLIQVIDENHFKYLRNNKAHQTTTGFSCAYLRGRTPQELVGNELGNTVAANYRRCLEQSGSISYEETLDLPGGKRTWQTTLTPIFQNGQAAYIVGSSQDITERKQAEQDLERERAFLSAVLDSIQEAIIICDKEGRIIRFNEAARKLHGRPEKPILPDQWVEYYDLYTPDENRPFSLQEIPLYRALQGERFQDLEIAVIPQHGGKYFLACNGQPLLDNQGRISGAVVTMFDITDRKRTEEQLKYLSFHDTLTGLYNRAYLENELSRLQKSREHPICIISMDLDGLKLINDTLGHNQGDRQLMVCAGLLAERFRASDIVVRTGGDEFVALLPQTGQEAGEKIVSRIRAGIDDHNQEAQENMPLSMSIGLACAADSGKDLIEVFKQADDQMYRDKLNKRVTSRVQLLDSHLAALENRDFFSKGHARRLKQLSLDIGQTIQLTKVQLMDLAFLAQVHDLGIVHIPEELLFKPGPLTADEWQIIRQHPEKGYRIAQAIPDLAGIANLILGHHEHWDGQGYPLGLSGQDIPIKCRILAIIDAYEVMTSGRPYKEAVSVREAIQELTRCAGSQFDPQLVQVLIQILVSRS